MDLKRVLSLFIILAIFCTSAQPLLADELVERNGVKHLYVEEGVKNIVILTEKPTFKIETNEFQTSRLWYGVLWTGIIVSFVYYLNSRRH